MLVTRYGQRQINFLDLLQQLVSSLEIQTPNPLGFVN